MAVVVRCGCSAFVNSGALPEGCAELGAAVESGWAAYEVAAYDLDAAGESDEGRAEAAAVFDARHGELLAAGDAWAAAGGCPPLMGQTMPPEAWAALRPSLAAYGPAITAVFWWSEHPSDPGYIAGALAALEALEQTLDELAADTALAELLAASPQYRSMVDYLPTVRGLLAALREIEASPGLSGGPDQT